MTIVKRWGAKISAATLFVLLAAKSALAVNITSVPQLAPQGGSLMNIAQTVVNMILIAVSVLAVIYLIYGGIQYVMAGGEAEKASKGRQTITNAIIGILIILASVAIYKAAATLSLS